MLVTQQADIDAKEVCGPKVESSWANFRATPDLASSRSRWECAGAELGRRGTGSRASPPHSDAGGQDLGRLDRGTTEETLQQVRRDARIGASGHARVSESVPFEVLEPEPCDELIPLCRAPHRSRRE